MKKIIPILVILSILLAGCGSLTGGNSQSVSDAQMATRVAQLLATMTTPTVEIDFPATPTVMQTPVVVTATPAVAQSTPVVAGGELPSATPEMTETDLPTATAAVTTATPTETAAATEAAATSTPASPTATATAVSGDPASNLGNPKGSDSMDSAANWTWPTGSDQYLNVNFSNGYMQMTGLTNFAGWRLPLVNQQVNSYIELTANSGSCQGKDSYGIIFRVPVFKDPSQGYLYEVTCDGYYRLWKWDGKAGEKGIATTLVGWAQSDQIKTGANQSNRLGVMVKDSTFTLYMNGVKLASGSDSAFGAGFFGVFVRSAQTSDYTVNFDAMKYWENP
jgi:hypothetical protein